MSFCHGPTPFLSPSRSVGAFPRKCLAFRPASFHSKLGASVCRLLISSKNWGSRCVWNHPRQGKMCEGTRDRFDTSQSVGGTWKDEPWEVGRGFLRSLRHMRRERSYGSSHVDEGGGAAQRLNQEVQVDLIEGGMTQDRTSGVFRSSPGIDRH
jgi:hypothetical protein